MNNGGLSEVLAKSEPRITLRQHIDDCLRILTSLVEAFPNLPVKDKARFWRLAALCIIFHDLGKVHIEFQKVLRGAVNKWYGQRHELLSVPWVDALDLPEDEKKIIKLVVAGHHKNIEELTRAYRNYKQAPKNRLLLDIDSLLDFNGEFLNNIDAGYVTSLLGSYNIALLAPNPPVFPGSIISSYKFNPVCVSHPDYMETILLSGALKQCDHMASASVPGIYTLTCNDLEFLKNDLQSKGFDLYSHQKKCLETLLNIILTAPTGSGKTESALWWLYNQIKLSGSGRVFYVLPFTASINAMYERLAKSIGKEKVGLLHGKLNEYIENLVERENPDIQKQQRDSLTRSLKDSYKTLVTPIKIVTPFQLLKHLFGLKNFDKGFFEWCGGYFIFDEIHAYRPDIFAQIIFLLQFITKHFNARVFIMTATLPSFLKRELEAALGDYISVTADENLYETFKRHRIRLAEGILTDNLCLIQQELNNGKRVLVVCNTVAQAQNTYSKLECENKVLLHSAFNACDRNSKEQQLNNDNSVRLLVGTQAIEVSLDIDYDILFSEPAPIDALIQRMGRINRKSKKGICECVIFKGRNESDIYIYTNAGVIARTLEVLEKFTDSVREDELQQAIDYVYRNWDKEDKDEYDTVYRALSSICDSNLAPFTYNKSSEEDFYSRFDGVKVLPARFETAFKEYLNDFEFIKAEGLKVQISKRQFARFSNPGGKDCCICKCYHSYSARDDKQLTTSYYTIKKEYDSDLGLLINRSDNNAYTDDQFI